MQGDMFTTGALIALMVLSFYFLILRPGRKRQQEQAKTMQALVPGARVLLASGVYGTLVSKSDQDAVVEIAPGVRVDVLSRAIVQVVPNQTVGNEAVGNEAVANEAGANHDATNQDVTNESAIDEVERGEYRDSEPPRGGSEPTQR